MVKSHVLRVKSFFKKIPIVGAEFLNVPNFRWLNQSQWYPILPWSRSLSPEGPSTPRPLRQRCWRWPQWHEMGVWKFGGFFKCPKSPWVSILEWSSMTWVPVLSHGLMTWMIWGYTHDLGYLQIWIDCNNSATWKVQSKRVEVLTNSIRAVNRSRSLCCAIAV